MSTADKLGQMMLALGVFGVVFLGILFLASMAKGKHGEKAQAASFVGPALAFLAIGLIWPTLLTIKQSFDVDPGAGLQNYVDIFTREEFRPILRNTALWVLLVPTLATGVGLLYAILVDRARLESLAKTMIFLPMAISMVGAGVIWKFVYEYKSTRNDQIGLFNAIRKAMGLQTQQFLLDAPMNTFWLIVVMVWIQAGFAMTILSASIKAIPDDIIEASKLDGVSAWQGFRHITLPTIRPSLVVVLTTIGIATLKVFDIVRTMTGGQFDTSVIANEFYNYSFTYQQPGVGSALAVILFVLVLPIVIYNMVQMRKDA